MSVYCDICGCDMDALWLDNVSTKPGVCICERCGLEERGIPWNMAQRIEYDSDGRMYYYGGGVERCEYDVQS